MTSVNGAACCCHCHVVRTNFCTVTDDDRTVTTLLVLQRLWQSRRGIYVVSAYRGKFATAIDAAVHLGLTLNGNRTIATYQCRVTMGYNTLTGTEHVFTDSDFIRVVSFKSNCHHSVLLHTANLTATIDGASYRTVTDGDSRSAVGVN